jgi:hypothetical protein
LAQTILQTLRQETQSTKRTTPRLYHPTRQFSAQSKVSHVERLRSATNRANMAESRRHRPNHGNSHITGAKHTVGREGKLKPFALELLKRLIKRDNLNAKSLIFPTTSDNLSEEFRHARNLLAKKHDKPELKSICLYDLRRFKGTRVYHLTNGKVLEVKQALGHKDLRSVEKYITLDANITWIPVKCTTDEEIQQAIKDDCTLVGHENGVWYFKKPA